ncbi:uncharacterized protein [Temnothorax nylanderi]|uniref:uncharacterized protein n=1 Tax=Temnothorax nylanderi TaxID=102681 RepID=UPI003A8AEA5F
MATHEHMEDLYSYIAIVMFVTDTLIICCLGFTIIASIGRPNALQQTIVKTLSFYFNTSMEAFIFCFAGEYLSAKKVSRYVDGCGLKRKCGRSVQHEHDDEHGYQCRVSNAIIGLHIATIVTYSLGIILSGDIGGDNFNITTAAVQALVLRMEFLFDINSSPVHELVFHVGGRQIDVTRERLINVFSSKHVNNLTRITINNLIEKHQKIILCMYRECESLYCYIALMQFISNTLIICSIGFVIAISINDPDVSTMLGKTVLFYIIINLEGLSFPFAGEYLNTKIVKVSASYVSMMAMS